MWLRCSRGCRSAPEEWRPSANPGGTGCRGRAGHRFPEPQLCGAYRSSTVRGCRADHSYEVLNQRGALSGWGQRFNSRIVARLRRDYQLKSRYERLREKGLLTLEEMSARLDIGPSCVITWRNHGILRGYPVNDRDDWLYEDPGPNPPRKAQGVKLAKRRLFPENVVRGSEEVQYEA